MARNNRMPKALSTLAAKHAGKIEEMSVERDEFDGPHNPYSYWCYLRPGWWNPRQEVHCIHEVNVKDFMEVWREVEPCDCDDCKERMTT